MALIKCPECTVEVSSAAKSCPKCAFPISPENNKLGQGGKVQTIELTSKKYKIQEIQSVLLIVGGLLLLFVGFATKLELLLTLGCLAGLAGIGWRMVIGFQVWWDHK